MAAASVQPVRSDGTTLASTSNFPGASGDSPHVHFTSETAETEEETLTRNSQDISILETLTYEESRQWLSSYLSLGEFDEEIELRKAITLDFTYNLISQLYRRGAGWTDIEEAMGIAFELQAAVISSESESAAFKYIVDSVQLMCQLSEVARRALLEFVSYSLCQHYRLYKFVFTESREDKSGCLNLIVDTVPPPQPLKLSRPKNICDYERQIKSIQNLEDNYLEELKIDHAAAIAEKEQYKTPTPIEDLPKPVEPSTLSAALDEVFSRHLASLRLDFMSSLQIAEHQLAYKLKKTAVPRPLTLGPPPRFKLLPLLTMPKEKSLGSSATKAKKK